MYRPGVPYWSFTASEGQQASLSTPATPPSASSPVAAHGGRSLHDESLLSLPVSRSLTQPPPQPPPPPSTPLPMLLPEPRSCSETKHIVEGGAASQQARMEGTKETGMRHLEALQAPEPLRHTHSLDLLRASLEREQVLRCTAENECRTLQKKIRELRTALAVSRAHSAAYSNGPGDSPASSFSTATVPLALYVKSCRLLQRYGEVFAELKALQSRATDMIGLEQLRRYELPAFTDIPCAWSLMEPQIRSSGATGEVGKTNSATGADGQVEVDAAASSPREATPSAVEISALTSASIDTPYNHPPPTPRRSGVALPPLDESKICNSSDTHRPSVERGLGCEGGTGREAGARGGVRQVLLSPPLPSPKSPSGVREDAWLGPMHRYAGDSTVLGVSGAMKHSRTTPGEEAQGGWRVPLNSPQQLSEYEKEDAIRVTDQLRRELAEEIKTLAQEERQTTASSVAALCRRHGLDYVDSDFLPVSETLGFTGGGCRGYDPHRGTSFVVRWCPSDAVVPRDHGPQAFTSTGVDPNALRCGRLDDRGVVAALAALAEATGAVASILASTTREDERNGVCLVWLCVHGWWTMVSVDTYLPCLYEAGDPAVLYGCSCRDARDLWAPICEKSLAKVAGNYEALCDLTADAVVRCFTGGPVEHWDWWRDCSETALEEMEAALNTNARGAGLVLLSTFCTAALHECSFGASPEATLRAAYLRLGLCPGTSYRVLGVTEDDDGEPMLLLRRWTRRENLRKEVEEVQQSQCEGGAGDACATQQHRDGQERLKSTSSRELGLNHVSVAPTDVAAVFDESCVWLHYKKEVLPLFADCYVGFDCRRFHDARYSIDFLGAKPAVAAQLIRVRVLESPITTTSCAASPPARLWIGLHQPFQADSGISAKKPLWALKMTLVGQEVVPGLYSGRNARTHPIYRSYILSESFMGVPQTLSAVWMYLELETADTIPAAVASLRADASANTAAVEFFVIPQMELVDSSSQFDDGGDFRAGRMPGLGTSASPHLAADRGDQRVRDVNRCRHTMESEVCSSSIGSVPTATAARSSDLHTTAVVAVLAEKKETVQVDVVVAPSELRAAAYHDALDQLDLSDCSIAEDEKMHPGQEPWGSLTVTRCQVNGNSSTTYVW